jgi:protein-tyrosine-phosphatase
MLNYFDKFLAVDLYVLNKLNTMYPKYRYKFLSLTMQFSDVNIIDPYHFHGDEYTRTMNDIKYVTEKINLEEFFKSQG